MMQSEEGRDSSAERGGKSLMTFSHLILIVVCVNQLANQEGHSSTGQRRGRKSKKQQKVDVKAKLERSRQSARECRARKKLRYQYLEDLVAKRERAVALIKKELEMVSNFNITWINGLTPGSVSLEPWTL